MRPFWRVESWHKECRSHLLQRRVCDRWRSHAQGIDIVGRHPVLGACLVRILICGLQGYFAFSAEDSRFFFYVSVHDAYWLFHFFIATLPTTTNLTNNSSTSNHVLAQDSAICAELAGDGSCWLHVVSAVFLSFLTVGSWLPTATGSFKAGFQNPQNLTSATFSWSKQVPSLAWIRVEGKEIPCCQWASGMRVHQWEEFLASVFRKRSTWLAFLFLRLSFPPSLFLSSFLPSIKMCQLSPYYKTSIYIYLKISPFFSNTLFPFLDIFLVVFLHCTFCYSFVYLICI